MSNETNENAQLQTLVSLEDLRELRESFWKKSRTLALVPTMGALHQGHLALVEKARTWADEVVVSIFVNPTQFGPNEDFARYPRTLKEDLAILREQGIAAAVFAPNLNEMYPEGAQTRVSNIDMATVLCGKSRPNHFEGVLTIVLKLFNCVQPDVAVFGKKDYQQWRIIERMVKDLDLPVQIEGVATERSPEGLAMSSRNRFLSESELSSAFSIPRSLDAVVKAFVAGERTTAKLVQIGLEQLDAAIAVDYFEIRGAKTLHTFNEEIDAEAVVFFAGRIGEVRLIDNQEIL